ncbi:MAG: hypothetical protein FJ319_05855 [SAR202 cluster bacterium]|nr:hypothetical protein [SAR202 cluster bacterium]
MTLEQAVASSTAIVIGSPMPGRANVDELVMLGHTVDSIQRLVLTELVDVRYLKGKGPASITFARFSSPCREYLVEGEGPVLMLLRPVHGAPHIFVNASSVFHFDLRGDVVHIVSPNAGPMRTLEGIPADELIGLIWKSVREQAQ